MSGNAARISRNPAATTTAKPQLRADQRADKHLAGVGFLGGLARIGGRPCGRQRAASRRNAARGGDADAGHACGRIRVASSFSRTEGRCRRLMGSSAPATVTLGRAAASFMWLTWFSAMR